MKNVWKPFIKQCSQNLNNTANCYTSKIIICRGFRSAVLIEIGVYVYISRKSTVIRCILPTRRPQADHFGLLSNVVFRLYLEGTPATPLHQNTRLPCTSPVRFTLCLRDMDSHFSRCHVPGGIPYKMPTQNPENLVEAIRSQLGNICAHWSTCYQRRHPTSSHRRLWPHRQTVGQHPST